MAKNKYTYKDDLKLFSYLNPPVVRAALPFMQVMMKSFYYLQKSSSDISIQKLMLTSPDGGKFRVLVYTPEGAKEKGSPLIVFYHGGGFVYNAAPHHFTMAKTLCRQLKVKVAFVDYRLAPKYPFPTAAEDAFCAYSYFVAYAEKYGIDKNKIAVCGDSAGGNLSAVVSLMARDKCFNVPCAQVLIYPFVDVDSNSESMIKFTDTPMCNSKATVGYGNAYVPGNVFEPVEYYSVVDAPSLSGLPAAYIETAEFDCLHDGGIKLYERLKKEGVSAELFETEGTMHGYDIATKSQTVSECTKRRVEFLKKAFEL